MDRPSTATTGARPLTGAYGAPLPLRYGRLGACLVLAAATGAIALGVYGLTQPPAPEEHCRIEVYADGSAEPLCQPGYQPTRPVAEWPIVRVQA